MKLAAALAVAGLWVAAAAAADPCAPLAGAATELQDRDPQARMDFLVHALEGEAHRARVYDTAWRGTYAALTVGQLAVAPLLDGNDRLVDLTGAASSLVGVIALTVAPLDVMSDGHQLGARVQQQVSEHGLCPALAQVQELLVRDERDERECVGWLEHAGNVAFNLALGAWIAYGLHDKTSGWINAVAGTAVGELMFATQPRRLTRVLSHYRTGRLAGDAP